MATFIEKVGLFLKCNCSDINPSQTGQLKLLKKKNQYIPRSVHLKLFEVINLPVKSKLVAISFQIYICPFNIFDGPY